MAWTTNRGWAFYDIRHKGQRIIYELSFQEALAHYAGTDPAQSTTSYLDASYDLGSGIVVGSSHFSILYSRLKRTIELTFHCRNWYRVTIVQPTPYIWTQST
jgi:hypothetical protein